MREGDSDKRRRSSPPLRAVAERAGVGIASASRALSGREGNSAEVRARVLKAAAELGYTPNLVAQGLRRRSSMLVGFVASDIANPLVAGVLRGAEQVLGAAGFSVLLTDSAGQPEADAARIRLMRQRQVDGLLILPVCEDHRETLEELRQTSVVVAVDRSLPEDLQASYVLSDHRPGMTAAATYLLSRGRQRLALVTGRNVRPARERLAALRASCPHDISIQNEPGSLTEEHGRDALARLLDGPTPPDAVLLGGNQLLVGALDLLRTRGLQVGTNLDIVTCDDFPLGRLHTPSVPAVARDIAAMGRAAAELLIERMTTSSDARSITLPTWFVPNGEAQPA